MSKTAREVIAEAIDIGGGQACYVPGVLKALDAAGFVIVPKDAASLDNLQHARDALSEAEGRDIYSHCDISSHSAAVNAVEALDDAIAEIRRLRAAQEPQS